MNDNRNQRYALKELLEKGRMGEVFLADDTVEKRQVLVRRVQRQSAAGPQLVEHLLREAALHAKLGDHTNIVSVLDRVENPAEVLIVTEHVPGRTLRQILDTPSQALTLQESVAIAIQVLQALEAIHALQVIHRSITPENIIAVKDADGVKAKIRDLGIARGSESAAAGPSAENPGAPLYLAPEQIVSEDYGGESARIDIYAVGIILYECLAGSPPFEGNFTQIIGGHLRQKPRPIVMRNGSGIPDPLAAALERSLSKHPSERFATAKAFREALQAAMGWPSAAAAASGSATKIPVAAARSSATIQAWQPAALAAPVGTRSKDLPKNNTLVALLKLVGMLAVFVALGAGLWFGLPALRKWLKPKLTEQQLTAMVMDGIRDPLQQQVTGQCTDALGRLQDYSENWAPTASATVEGLKLEKIPEEATTVTGKVNVTFTSRFKEAFRNAVYLSHFDYFTAPQTEALNWLSHEGAVPFTITARLDGERWTLASATPAADAAADPKAPIDLTTAKQRTTPAMLEQKFTLKEVTTMQKFFTDKALVRNVALMRQWQDELQARTDSEQSFTRQANEATANASRAQAEAVVLTKQKAPKEEIAKRHAYAAEQTKLAASYQQSAQIEHERQKPISRKLDWLVITTTSYATGRRYLSVAAECGRLIKKYDDESDGIVADIIKKYKSTLQEAAKP